MDMEVDLSPRVTINTNQNDKLKWLTLYIIRIVFATNYNFGNILFHSDFKEN